MRRSGDDERWRDTFARDSESVLYRYSVSELSSTRSSERCGYVVKNTVELDLHIRLVNSLVLNLLWLMAQIKNLYLHNLSWWRTPAILLILIHVSNIYCKLSCLPNVLWSWLIKINCFLCLSSSSSLK